MSLKNNFKTHKSVNCPLVLCHCNQPLSLFFSCQVPCRRLCVRRKEGEFEIELKQKLKYEIKPILHEYIKDGILLDSAREVVEDLHV